ncbi:MAG TPA: ricin-type beta-trefoil lectin domain protein [Patescibacteria group bacterium]|nr:ricin-type beta-trefoil lectin domain protein [Patescibacteria group bacterium]
METTTPPRPDLPTVEKKSSIGKIWGRLSGSRYRLAIFVATFAVIGGIVTLLITHADTTNGPINWSTSNKCLDLDGGRQITSNKVKLYTCNGSSAQQWTIRADNTIHANNENNWCLDVINSSTTPGTPVQLYTCNGTGAQRWTLTAQNTLVNTNSGLCLDNFNSQDQDNNAVNVYTCNGTGAQRWTPAKVASAQNTPEPAVTVKPSTPAATPLAASTGTNGSVAAQPVQNATLDDDAARAAAPKISQPAWRDEFNGNSLSYATENGGGTWRTRGTEGGGKLADGYIDYAGSSWNANQKQIQANGLATVGGGALTLKTKRTPANKGPFNNAKWMGAYLVSNDATNLSWHYGYFEWRMSLPNPARGMFPAIWLFNNAKNPVNGYQGAEIDMLEVFGSRTGEPWSSGVHFTPKLLNGVKDKTITTQSSDTGGWHRYGVNWTANSITFYKDGTAVGSLTGAGAQWFRNANLGIRINYAMDPSWKGVPTAYKSTATDPKAGTTPSMKVDYVRYYKALPGSLPKGSGDPL